jgi:AraC family transcriptional regulator of adaptative response/methylated-DNA-[protein]-cysteine methyltransferase
MLKKHPELLYYGIANSIFGECCIIFDNDSVFAIGFDQNGEVAPKDLFSRFPRTIFIPNQEKSEALCRKIFNNPENIQLNPIGSDFQLSVWKELQNVKSGTTSTYGDIAKHIGNPKAVRAVASAIGANPVAWLIPCHRIVKSDGSIGGFHWGSAIKKRMLDYEKKSMSVNN